MLTVGDTFPDYCLTAAMPDGGFASVSRSDDARRWKVLFFWPADFTFVCPTEVSAFGRAAAAFASRGAVVLGCSTDTHWVHKAWRESNPMLSDLGIPMLSDPKRELTGALGVLGPDGLARRATFIVDPQGVVRFASVVDDKVGRSVSETLRVLDALQTDELTPCEWRRGEPTLEG